MRTHRKTLWLWRSLALATVALPASACVDANVGDIELCKYEGKGRKLNEKFPASDGCNTCKCTIDGDVECTELDCSDDPVMCDEMKNCAGPGTGVPYTDAGTSAPYSDAGRGGPYVDAGKFPNCDPTKGCYDPGTSTGLDYCVYADGKFKLGETFPAGDGCNNCFCGMTGDVSCTDKACIPPDGNAKPGTCIYAGSVYKTGEYFGATDMCSKCTCTESGAVACTHDGCPNYDAGTMAPPTQGSCTYQGKTYQVGQGFERGDSCNKCVCSADGVVECTSNNCMTPPGCAIGPTLIPTGKSITCADGCNTCTCNQKNILDTTEIACGPLPVIPKCDSSTMVLQFPATLAYLQGDSLAVGDSRCVNGQANDFSLCFEDLASTMGQETWIFAVAGTGSRACNGRERVYSLSELRAAYHALTGQMVGKVVINGSGSGTSLVYPIGI